MGEKMMLYSTLSCWEWVFEDALRDEALREVLGVTETSRVRTVFDLPSTAPSPVVDCGHGKKRRQRPPVSFCRLETMRDDKSERAVWFSGTAFSILGDKDILVKELINAELADIAPASEVIEWDISTEQQVLFPSGEGVLSVLKPPLGCQGNGIAFVTHKLEVLDIVTQDANAARNERDFIENIKRTKGRIPGWVLQNYVPSLLIDNRKFHLRAYVIIHQNSRANPTQCGRIMYYDSFECRIACDVYDGSDHSNRKAHITNGAGGSDTKRVVLEEIEHNIFSKQIVTELLQKMFGCEKLRTRLLEASDRDHEMGLCADDIYSLAALDIMVDSSLRPWLLEVNAKCPACPDRGLGSELYQKHLIGLAGDLIKLGLSCGGLEKFVEILPQSQNV